MTQKIETLQQLIAEGLGGAAVAEHGRPVTRYVMEVGSEPIGGGIEGHFATLTVYPEGFNYKAITFGVDNNTLLTRDELEARKQYLINEARAAAANAQTQAQTGGTAA